MKRMLLSLALIAALVPAIAPASRQPHSLERWEMSRLSIWSLHVDADPARSFAYIKDPDGYLHRIVAGEYMGKHEGRINTIERCAINFTELHDGKGGKIVLSKRTLAWKDCELYADPK